MQFYIIAISMNTTRTKFLRILNNSFVIINIREKGDRYRQCGCKVCTFRSMKEKRIKANHTSNIQYWFFLVYVDGIDWNSEICCIANHQTFKTLATVYNVTNNHLLIHEMCISKFTHCTKRSEKEILEN